MAVIKNKKTGMWEVRTYYKDLTGARKQKTKRGFAKKSEALEWERNFKLKEDQSISMSFKSFVDIYLTDLEPRIKRNTFLTKKHIIETKILPYFGKRKLDDIRTSDVIQWQNEIMKLKKFIGAPSMNIFDGEIDNGNLIVGDKSVSIPEEWKLLIGNRSQVKFGIRPEHVKLMKVPEGPSVNINYVENQGDKKSIAFLIEDNIFMARILSGRSADRRISGNAGLP